MNIYLNLKNLNFGNWIIKLNNLISYFDKNSYKKFNLKSLHFNQWLLSLTKTTYVEILNIYLYFLFFSLSFSPFSLLFFSLYSSRDWEMSSEGCREASVFETGKGAVRERISLACQPWHSGMQGTYFHRYSHNF